MIQNGKAGAHQGPPHTGTREVRPGSLGLLQAITRLYAGHLHAYGIRLQ